MKLSRFTAIIPALLLAACNTESPAVSDEGFYEFTLEAATMDPGTRTSYRDDRYFSWTEGDEISVLFHSGSTDKFFTLTAQNAGATATFKGNITNGYSLGASDGKKWGLYPAGEHTYSEGTVNFCQPSEVDLSGGFSANIPLAALGTDANAFVFKPMCSVVKFSFTALDAQAVTFTVTNQYSHALSGSFPCTEGGYYLYWKPRQAGSGSPDRSISYTSDVSGGCAAFYVPVSAWNVSNFIPSITLEDSSTGAVLYSATAKRGFPSKTNDTLGSITVVPSIDCSPDPDNLATVAYTESDEDFINPERGYYTQMSFSSASDNPLTVSKIRSSRYLGRSLMLLSFYLTDFMESDISSAYLSLIRSCFDALRNGGDKCILRFAYKDDNSQSGHPWDPTEERVLSHIAQLKPLLQEYSDVIFVLQAGFIGVWGEWYYTDNFVQNPSSASDYLPRKHVLETLLDALPSDRQVAVRTPKFKMKLLGLGASDYLTGATAHDGSDAARIAAHNDCFVASPTDQGTFLTDSERSFWKADTKYTIMGGETCAVSDYCHCESSGSAPGALSELESYHWTYLNSGYNQEVLKLWRTEGCSDEVSARLGYRLVLTGGSFTANPRAGGSMKAVLRLVNKGFAAPMNPRDAFLVLTDAAGAELARWDLGSDPRDWQPDSGVITVEKTFTVPSSASGELSLHLALPDPCSNLSLDPRYSIRLANEDVWDEDTGLNLLYTFSL